MILLDTNVLSELMRPQPSADVIRWVDNQLTSTLFTNAVTRAEIELGIALLPAYTVSMNVQKGRIQSILSEYLSVDRHIYACYLPSKYLPIKIRIFIDFLKETIGTNPYWNDNPPTMKKLMNR